VLVATDVASRGIDVDKTHACDQLRNPGAGGNLCAPYRQTGRAGETGAALSFCSADEKTYLKNIHKLIHKNIDVVTHTRLPLTNRDGYPGIVI